jgi:hypothetical protein
VCVLCVCVVCVWCVVLFAQIPQCAHPPVLCHCTMLSSPVISITNTFLPPNSPYSSSFLSLLPPSLSPQAALAAVIMVSINSLLSFSDLWEAFKHKKKDFIVMLVTLTITFVTETSTGLAVGTV